MHSYATLKAAVVAEASKHGQMFPGGCFEASVGAHSVYVHIRERGPRFGVLVYGQRSNREQLDAALAKLPADAQMTVYRRGWN